MSEQFRASMSWLHTWAGLVIGGLLFAIFWMGMLSVFDREIDRWMMPETRRAAATSVSLDAAAHTLNPLAAESKARRWGMQLPTDRVPTLRAYIDSSDDRRTLHLDPKTGEILAEQRTLGATGFFFPFHFSLFIDPLRIGEWLVGLAAITMMAMCVSGVVIHRKIFADFFMLRIVRKPQQTTLDIHNVTGVLGLPFNFLIAFSGLVIFMGIYLPGVQTILYPNDPVGFGKDAYGNVSREATGKPGTLASLDAMAVEASRRWGGDRPGNVTVWNPGDAAAYVNFNRSYANRVTMNSDMIVFEGSSGRVLSGPNRHGPMMTTQRFLSGMHFIQFKHWTLRWLYFVSGLAGCVLIATGYIFWIQSRAKRHAKEGVRGMAVVRGLSVGATIGLVVATITFLIANRALPNLSNIGGIPRCSAEVWAFCLSWLACFAHAWLRPSAAWREQGLAVALMGLSATALNWITTGDAIPNAIASGQWGVAGVDLVILAGAGVAIIANAKLRAVTVPPSVCQSARPSIAAK